MGQFTRSAFLLAERLFLADPASAGPHKAGAAQARVMPDRTGSAGTRADPYATRVLLSWRPPRLG